MKALAEEGLEKERTLFAEGQSVRDLEIGVEFWLGVEECEACDVELCSAHYQRFYDTM